MLPSPSDIIHQERINIRFMLLLFYRAGIHFHFIWFPLRLLLLSTERLAIGVCPYLSSSSMCRFINEKVIISQSKINYKRDSYSWPASQPH